MVIYLKPIPFPVQREMRDQRGGDAEPKLYSPMKMSFLQAYGPLILAVVIGALLGAALGYFGQCTSGTCPLTSTWWRGAIYGSMLGLLFGLSSNDRSTPNEKGETPPALSRVSPSSGDRQISDPNQSARPQ